MPVPSLGWWSGATSRGIRSLADLRGKRVGIVTGTVALSEKDHKVARFKSREELLDGFASGDARRGVSGCRLRRLVSARSILSSSLGW